MSRQNRISLYKIRRGIPINCNLVGGFTLVEVLVAVVVFGLLLGGVSTLAVYSLQFTDNYKNSVKAALLAQEGIELIREARDTNRLNGDSWLQGITNPSGIPCGKLSPNRGCFVEVNTSNGNITFQQCPGSPPLNFGNGDSGCPFIEFDPVMKLYGNNGTEITSFQRTIHVIEFSSPSALQVRVMITWTTRFGPRKLIVQDTLTDWQ